MSNIYTVEDLGDDIETVVLEVNPEAKYVPSRNFQSETSRIVYKVRNHDSILEVLKDDADRLLSFHVSGVPLFIPSDKNIKELKRVEQEQNELQKAPAEPVQTPSTEEVHSNDDLTVIKGIGNATQDKLYAAGINSYEKLSRATIEEMEALDINPEWMTEAKNILVEIEND